MNLEGDSGHGNIDEIQGQVGEKTHSPTVGMTMAAGLLMILSSDLIGPIVSKLSGEERDLLYGEADRIKYTNPKMEEYILREAMKGSDMQIPPGALDEPVFSMAAYSPGEVAGIIRSWIKERQEPSENFSFKIQP